MEPFPLGSSEVLLSDEVRAEQMLALSSCWMLPCPKSVSIAVVLAASFSLLGGASTEIWSDELFLVVLELHQDAKELVNHLLGL